MPSDRRNSRLLWSTGILLLLLLVQVRADEDSNSEEAAAMGMGAAAAADITLHSLRLASRLGSKTQFGSQRLAAFREQSDTSGSGSNEYNHNDDADAPVTSRPDCSLPRMFRGECDRTSTTTAIPISKPWPRVPLDFKRRNRKDAPCEKCVVNRVTGECSLFDNRTQAATLRQAMLSFVDLNSDLPTLRAGKDYHCDMTCVSELCRSCVQAFLRLLTMQTNWLSWDQARSLKNEMNADAPTSVPCPALGEPPRLPQTSDQSAALQYVDMCLRSTERVLSSRNRRQKRAAPSPPLIGERTRIRCVRKGHPASESAEYASLCTQCWVIRRLPETHFPRYVNELVCHNNADEKLDDDGNAHCFGGYGSCQEQTRSTLVQETIRQGKVANAELSTASHCECTMSLQSPMLPFIQA